MGIVEPRQERGDVGKLDGGAAPDPQARRGVAVAGSVQRNPLPLEGNVVLRAALGRSPRRGTRLERVRRGEKAFWPSAIDRPNHGGARHFIGAGDKRIEPAQRAP